MTDDLRGHRVVQTVLRRRDERSRPGARTDGRRIALVIEGGGMRGVVSAGMTAAIEQLGLRDAFDEVHGASAGAFNAAFLLAGQAAYLTTLYQHGFGDPRFVSVLRALRGGPAFDMDYVIDHVWTHQRPLRFEAIRSSGITLHCTATDADSAAIVDLSTERFGELPHKLFPNYEAYGALLRNLMNRPSWDRQRTADRGQRHGAWIAAVGEMLPHLTPEQRRRGAAGCPRDRGERACLGRRVVRARDA